MRTYRIDVGHQHGVQPGNIVGAIADEATWRRAYRSYRHPRSFTLVDLPDGISKPAGALRTVRVASKPLRMRGGTAGHRLRSLARPVATVQAAANPADSEQAGFRPAAALIPAHLC